MAHMSDHVVVLGLGNANRSDKGLGVLAMRRLTEQFDVEGRVSLIDGGTTDLDLLTELEGTSHLLVLDAILGEGPAGTVAGLADGHGKAILGQMVSADDVALPEVLEVMTMCSSEPDDIVVLGLIPADVGPGGDLSAQVEAALDSLVASARRQLGRWGIASPPRLKAAA